MLENATRVVIVNVKPTDAVYGKSGMIIGMIIGTVSKAPGCIIRIVLLDEPMQNGDRAVAITEACLLADDLGSPVVYE